MAQVTIKEAAKRLQISELTVRRRITKGFLQGIQEPTPQGYVWMVEVSDEEAGDTQPPNQEIIRRMEETMELLREQVRTQQEELGSKNNQIQQLHVLLQQAQAALPAPKENHDLSWWRFWSR